MILMRQLIPRQVSRMLFVRNANGLGVTHIVIQIWAQALCVNIWAPVTKAKLPNNCLRTSIFSNRSSPVKITFPPPALWHRTNSANKSYALSLLETSVFLKRKIQSSLLCYAMHILMPIFWIVVLLLINWMSKLRWPRKSWRTNWGQWNPKSVWPWTCGALVRIILSWVCFPVTWFWTLGLQCGIFTLHRSCNVNFNAEIQIATLSRYINILTGSANDPGITAHYIDKFFNLYQPLLAFEALEERHTGVYLATIVLKVIHEYGITEKLNCITTDNASNNFTMVQHLSSRLFEEGIEWDYRTQHIPCLAHIINLVVKEFLNNLEEDEEDGFSFLATLKKIRAIAKAIRSSPRKWEIFEQCCKSYDIWPMTIPLDIAVR